MEVPLIETERLRLRAFQVNDFDSVYAILSDPVVMEMMGGKALEREEAWRRLLTARGMWELMGFGYWMLERKSDLQIIGQAGFADFRRDMTPSIEGALEAGWLLSTTAFAQGYATEAARACLQWARINFQGRPVVATIDPSNKASVRVAQKIGEWEQEEASYRGGTILLLRLIK